MRYLFIHQNFPGQFRHVAAALAEIPTNTVVAMGDAAEVKNRPMPSTKIRWVPYELSRQAAPQTHHYLRGFENNVLRGQSVVRVAISLKNSGFEPDLIVVHTGWGESLYLKEVFPRAKTIGYFEFFYHSAGADVDFDPEFPSTFDDKCRVHTRNATQLLAWSTVDAGWSPTQWQANLYPAEYHPRINVIHEGVDTALLKPDDTAQFELPNGKILTPRDEVITFINRNLEPYRGFHVFMRTLAEVLKARPNAQVLMVGGDEVSYGKKHTSGLPWREVMVNEVGNRLDMNRIHFLGRIPYLHYIKLLQVSSVHVYLTYPFVLSWSLLEAMSVGCLIVASKTPPVEEVIQANDTGILFPFFDMAMLRDSIIKALNDQTRYRSMRQCARDYIVENYDLATTCLPEQLDFFQRVLG